MVEYQNRQELILEISSRAKLFIEEFNDINEKDKNRLILLKGLTELLFFMKER